jgi:hypothetical protein
MGAEAVLHFAAIDWLSSHGHPGAMRAMSKLSRIAVKAANVRRNVSIGLAARF